MTRSAALLLCLLGCHVWKAVTKTLREPGAGAQGGCARGRGARPGRRAFVWAAGPAAEAAAAGRPSGRIVWRPPEPGLQPPRRAPEGAAPPGDAEGPGADAPEGPGTAGGAGSSGSALGLARSDASEGPFLYAVSDTRLHVLLRLGDRGAPGSPPPASSAGPGPRSPGAKAALCPFVVVAEGMVAVPAVPPASRDPEVRGRCLPPACRSSGKFRGLLFLPTPRRFQGLTGSAQRPRNRPWKGRKNYN